MIDEIYFFGDKNLSDEFVKVIGESSILLTPEKSNMVNLSADSIHTGEELMTLFEKYDNIYLDLREIEINDSGMGILSSLGCTFYDEADEKLSPKGTNLYYIYRIEFKRVLPDHKKLRLILSKPRENCSNIICGRHYRTSPFEGELLIRSLHNVMIRLEDCGYNTLADLKTFDSGGISTFLASVLNEEGVKYIFDKDINPLEFGDDIYYEIFGGKNGKSWLQS